MPAPRLRVRYVVRHLYWAEKAAGCSGYYWGVTATFPGNLPDVADGWLAWMRQNYEHAPKHIVQMWRETFDPSGARPMRSERLYESTGAYPGVVCRMEEAS